MTLTHYKDIHQWDGELGNTCTCLIEKEDGTCEIPDDCFGDCWEDQLGIFGDFIKEFFEGNEMKEWQVDGLPLWNRTVSGKFFAKKIADFVEGITVRGEWHLFYKLENDALRVSLSHHDVPTGGTFYVRYAEQTEE